MAISKDEVLKVAKLARLELNAAEVESMTRDLGAILEYVQALNKVDTKDVVPTAHLASRATPLREDVVRDSLSQSDALANAPKSGGGGFLVPKVVDAG